MAKKQDDIDPKERYQYDETFAIDLCIRIAEGESPANVCKEPDCPHPWSRIRQWVKTIPEFERAYWYAKKEQSEAIYAQIQEIERRMMLPANISDVDIFTGEVIRHEKTNKPVMVANPEYINPNSGRSIINSLQWRAEKVDPERYGHKMHVQTEDLTLQNRIIEARERLRNARSGKPQEG